MLTVLGRWARSKRFLVVQAMSEEQLKAVETEATAQVEENVEEISEDALEGVAGGSFNCPDSQRGLRYSSFPA